MRPLLYLAAFALAVALTTALAGAAPRAGAPDNSPPLDFVALFNGKDLTGWQAAVPFGKRLKLSPEELAAAQRAADEKVLPHWKVEDGILINDGRGDNLATVKDYGDIELR